MDSKILFILIAAIISLLGVTMIFDARNLSKKLFGFGDQNEATMGMKIFGFVLAIIGAFIVFFQLR